MNLQQLQTAHEKAWQHAKQSSFGYTPSGHTHLDFEECQCRATNNLNSVEWLINYRKVYGTARIVVFVSEGHGKPYRAIGPMVKAPVGQRSHMMITIERDLNDGLLCQEAEVEWPKQGLHNKPTYKAKFASSTDLACKKYAHLKDCEHDAITKEWKKLFIIPLSKEVKL